MGDEDDEQAAGVVCQLLQCIYMVTEELEAEEEEYGCVAAFLPGWNSTAIHGPSVEDPQEFVELPVIPFGDGMDEFTSMEEMVQHLGQDGMEALMEKLGSLQVEDGGGN